MKFPALKVYIISLLRIKHIKFNIIGWYLGVGITVALMNVTIIVMLRYSLATDVKLRKYALRRGNMKVLVVDDNKIMTTILRMMIEKKNHQVITANDGNDGYAAYLNFRPDLVLTDIQMPGKNGFELMATIREHNPAIMAIYMTGDPGRFLTQLRKEQYTHKVDFICKPFSVSELSTMLSKHRVLSEHQD